MGNGQSKRLPQSPQSAIPTKIIHFAPNTIMTILICSILSKLTKYGKEIFSHDLEAMYNSCALTYVLSNSLGKCPLWTKNKSPTGICRCSLQTYTARTPNNRRPPFFIESERRSAPYKTLSQLSSSTFQTNIDSKVENKQKRFISRVFNQQQLQVLRANSYPKQN